MPTSVLLAVLVAAGLLALAPALVRRYDATERLDADRVSSTARVLRRQRRRRTVPGRVPVNPAGQSPQAPDATPPPSRPEPGGPPRVPRPRDPVELRRWWQRRRRRVFGTLVALVAVEATGAAVIGPGFFVGLSLSLLFLFGYASVLRNAVVVDHRHRLERRWQAAQRAAAEAAERRSLAERHRRISEARRYAQQLARERAAAERAAGPPTTPGLRGTSYEARAANF